LYYYDNTYDMILERSLAENPYVFHAN